VSRDDMINLVTCNIAYWIMMRGNTRVQNHTVLIPFLERIVQQRLSNVLLTLLHTNTSIKQSKPTFRHILTSSWCTRLCNISIG